MKISTKFILYPLFFSLYILLKIIQTTVFEYDILKHPESIVFSDLAIFFHSYNDVLCYLYALTGQFSECHNFEMNGFFIKDHLKLPKILVLLDLDIPFYLDNNLKYPRIYSSEDEGFSSQFLKNLTNIETIKLHATNKHDKPVSNDIKFLRSIAKKDPTILEINKPVHFVYIQYDLGEVFSLISNKVIWPRWIDRRIQ
ncbi:hypothetical protein HZS_1144 [Henneguya salminicola]|nr:hypothetical protein HZS_1144 [Henneguya salminicola]